ncbi:hypothetical protein EBU58_05845 [bacterium]|jgi:hypothetical protein|nr:hypothetical protein [bacterium]
MGSKLGLFGKLWRNNFAKPTEDRVLTRHLIEHHVANLLEIGVGTAERAERLLTAASQPIRYVGLDPFESRRPEDPPGISLKEAHQRLGHRAHVQLVPGPVDTTLARVCNHIGTFDLVLVSNGLESRDLERVWFFVRRLVRPSSAVFQQSTDGAWGQLSPEEIDTRSRQVLGRQAA